MRRRRRRFCGDAIAVIRAGLLPTAVTITLLTVMSTMIAVSWPGHQLLVSAAPVVPVALGPAPPPSSGCSADDWAGVGTAGLVSAQAGALSALLQVALLMPLRTVTNVQYMRGQGLPETLAQLYAEGGLPRLYQGWGFAVLQAPCMKAGAVAANDVVLRLRQCSQVPGLGAGALLLPMLLSAVLSGLWRMFLTPIDTCKTVRQVHGPGGHALLSDALRHRPCSLYQGALASGLLSAIGSYPWFLTYNWLQVVHPVTSSLSLHGLAWNAVAGFAASAASDTVTNCVRVVKTSKQTLSLERRRMLSYRDALLHVTSQGGLRSLLTRGLGTRILSNGLQSMVFAMLWPAFKALA